MSLEIRELVIKASVVGQKSSTHQDVISKSELKKLKKEIINECIEKMMSKMDDINHR